MYPADGRKLPDVHSHPPNLRHDLQQKLGTFPLFHFWGPATDISATRWIADASIEVDRRHNPTLTLIYLPHMDYVLQKEGPAGPTVGAHLRDLDTECGKLIDHYQSKGARVVILSEYGIAPVSRPVHLNRALRQAGLLTIRDELGRDLLDAGASPAFAVADHQLAHVYVKDPARIPEVKRLLQQIPGVAAVLDAAEQPSIHLDHPRSGDLVCLAEPDSWFTYYFWLDDAKAPDYARTVDIHRKPGYDPVELFLDPTIPAPKLRIAYTLAKRKLGLRTLMQVIPLDATLVKGSHGLAPAHPHDGAIWLTSEKPLLTTDRLSPTDISTQILNHLTH
jgi:predicted AlkP superfamily pyrophosphatase or phosphodiesterase